VNARSTLCDLCHSFFPPPPPPSLPHATAEETLANSRGVVDLQSVSRGGGVNGGSSSLHRPTTHGNNNGNGKGSSESSSYERNAGANEGAMMDALPSGGGAGWGGSGSVSDAQ
jgi:hypothetical protein